jgi:hypothetical protein
MAAEYQQTIDPTTGTISATVLRLTDSAYIPDDPGNRDRVAYQEWLEAGNMPDPPDPPPEPPPPAPVVLPAAPVSDMDAATKGYVDGEVSAMTARLDALERQLRG